MKPNLFKLFLTVIVLTVSFNFSSAQKKYLGRVVSFQSFNFPTKFIRHRNFAVEISDIKTDLDTKDSQFRVVQALNGRAGYVSFESVNYPGYYLRHQNFMVFLHKGESAKLYKEDASFKIVDGLIGTGVSFQSSNYPEYYMRHQNFRVIMSKYSNESLFQKDASFMADIGTVKN